MEILTVLPEWALGAEGRRRGQEGPPQPTHLLIINPLRLGTQRQEAGAMYCELRLGLSLAPV